MRMLFASTVINYIDRQTLSVLAPFLKTEYHWTNSDFALVVIAFRVADTGIGIPENIVPKLFRIDSKYQQADTNGDKGTGLGLILCKDLIEKNNGRIKIESELNKGTTVRIHIPQSAPKE